MVTVPSLLLKMEVFSFEEDDGNDLFLTQRSSSDGGNVGENNNKGILGDPMDFSSPVVGVVSGTANQLGCTYEDISDEEDFQIPCSQVANNDQRSVQ